MSDSQPVHVPVLLEEVITWLNVQPGHIVVDGTLGGGGHTSAFAEAVGSGGRVIAIDRDPAAVQSAIERIKNDTISIERANYCNLPEVLTGFEIEHVDAILLDLGLSSDQLSDDERGFSFHSTGPLDLRYNPNHGEAAWQIINRLSEKHLADLIYEFGEERYSRRIARKIVNTRRENPIRTALQLAQLVRSCIPRRKADKIDPATRTFQALRIAVNQELKSIDVALRRLPDCLTVGGRIGIISFHSLEDRPVKTAFREDQRLKVLTKKPIGASEEEIARNPRSRSAKFRVAEKIEIV